MKPLYNSSDYLAEMSDQYSRLVEGSPDGILIGRHGRLVLANAAALGLFRVDTAEQILGTGIVDLFTPETRDTVRAFLDRVRPDGERELAAPRRRPTSRSRRRHSKTAPFSWRFEMSPPGDARKTAFARARNGSRWRSPDRARASGT
jgi:PAS domain S-box-containing protein